MNRARTICTGNVWRISATLMVTWMFCWSASAGLVLVDRTPPPLSDWANARLMSSRSEFANAIQLYSDGKLEACHDSLAKLSAANATLPHPDLVIAWLQLSDQRLSQAKSRLETLAAAAPRDPQVALTLAQIALAESRLADAAAHLERTAQLQLPEAWPIGQRTSFARTTLDTLTIVYERQTRWSDAKSLLTTLIAMGDTDLHYTKRLARAHYNLGELEQAKTLLQQVAEGSAGLPVPLLLADFAFSSGKFQDADEAIQQAVEQYPNNSEVQLWFAEWSLIKNDVDAAERALASTKKSGLVSSRYWISFGQCHMLRGNYGNAVKAFRQATEKLAVLKEPHRTAVATNLLALALICQQPAKASEHKEAVSIAEKNALAYSSDSVYVGSLGWIYFKLGRVEEAEPLLRRALELNPHVTSDLSFFLADFYAQSKEKSDVAATFLKAAAEGSQGIFIMRPQANQLSKTLLDKK